MRLQNILIILLVLTAVTIAVWATRNAHIRQQQVVQQQQLFKNYLLLQQRQAHAGNAIENDSLYQQLYNYALQHKDTLLLKGLQNWMQRIRAENAGPNRSAKDVAPSLTSKTSKQQGSTNTRRLEDSLQKIKVLLEMEKTIAQEQMQAFRKTSDSLLHLLTNNASQTGILYLKSPSGISIQYVGEIKNDAANGFGMGIWENGHKYEGQWQNNIKHGWGTYYFANGEKYEGNFENNKRSGKGTYYFKSGDYYKGFWQEDMREGVGVIYGRGGKIKKAGEWKRDKLLVNRRLTDEELQQIH